MSLDHLEEWVFSHDRQLLSIFPNQPSGMDARYYHLLRFFFFLDIEAGEEIKIKVNGAHFAEKAVFPRIYSHTMGMVNSWGFEPNLHLSKCKVNSLRYKYSFEFVLPPGYYDSLGNCHILRKKPTGQTQLF